jgi:hypothetical protein
MTLGAGQSMSNEQHELAAFLVEAKRRTYAGLDDDASVTLPLLPGSKQLEYQAGSYAYRDIYFGMSFFVGQETVSKDGNVFWSLCYSGGAHSDVSDRNLLLAIYKFLRKSLLAVHVECPFRGPASFATDDMSYCNRLNGDLTRFHGVEEISQRGKTVYELRYSGGMLR